ncbi:MAG TPA: outer membrane protein assembly factor BamD [Pyrinomonadaceae bacterium]|nr:outer membrane protein assembly factor BamD [Pyrinomonadaceae bacterium]
MLCFVSGAAASVRAQDNQKPPAGQDLDANSLPEELLLADAKKNLKAAQLYYTRKAYVGALQRCEETIAVYQRFKKFDEVLYIAGMSSARLARKEGKQTLPAEMTPEKYLVLARQYLSQLVNEHPKSGFRKRAEEELRMLDASAPQADAKQ